MRRLEGQAIALRAANMRISRLRIQRFRSIRNLELELGKTTVLVGANNAGKTAILEALRIVLTRRWGQRGTGFTELDVHLPSPDADPRQQVPVIIEITCEETEEERWPDDLVQELADVMQLDVATGLHSVILRATCSWNEATSTFEPAWEFLNLQGVPLGGTARRAINLQEFFQYLPVFYLAPLRDAEDELSSRSQFWRRLLKAMQVPPDIEAQVKTALDNLNHLLLGADARLAQVRTTFEGLRHVGATEQPGGVDLRVVPLNSWDILSRTEIVLQNEVTTPWMPLTRHGQGVQSLSVILLFQAFVSHALQEFYKPGSVPILLLEEPEVHLHPQPTRSLLPYLAGLPGQKIVTTHSPYLLQGCAFRDIRIVRLTSEGTAVASLPSAFTAPLPHIPAIDPVLAASGGRLRHTGAGGRLVVSGKLEETTCRALMACYGTHPERATVLTALRDLQARAALYMSDEELADLETWARRIRGEIFFAQRWLLVEGQCEYLVAHAMAEALGTSLDRRGIAVIDFQNNGNLDAFIALARALAMPWRLIVDGDQEGQACVASVQAMGFSPAEVAACVAMLPHGTFEEELVASGIAPELRAIAAAMGLQSAEDPAQVSDAQLCNWISQKRRKTAYAARLSAHLRLQPGCVTRMPQPFIDAVHVG